MRETSVIARLARLWRHFWRDETDTRRCLPTAALARLTERVRLSESGHRGQIRLCIESSLPVTAVWAGMTPRARALDRFAHLGVWDTEANVGVLIYLLLADRAVEIVADRGLRHRVSAAQWTALTGQMGQAFADGQFEAGLLAAVEAVDGLLRQEVPRQPGEAQANELPDAPVLG